MTRFQWLSRIVGNAGVILWPTIIVGVYCLLLSEWTITSLRLSEEDDHRERIFLEQQDIIRRFGLGVDPHSQEAEDDSIAHLDA